MEPEHAAKQVAKWMLKELKRRGKLRQDIVVFEIAEKFGSQYTCEIKNARLAIRKDVLAAFRKLTKDSVVWVQEDSHWRMREARDSPGRQQG